MTKTTKTTKTDDHFEIPSAMVRPNDAKAKARDAAAEKAYRQAKAAEKAAASAKAKETVKAAADKGKREDGRRRGDDYNYPPAPATDPRAVKYHGKHIAKHGWPRVMTAGSGLSNMLVAMARPSGATMADLRAATAKAGKSGKPWADHCLRAWLQSIHWETGYGVRQNGKAYHLTFPAGVTAIRFKEVKAKTAKRKTATKAAVKPKKQGKAAVAKAA